MRRAAAAAAALACALAACGGHDREAADYVDAVNAAQSRFEQRIERVSRSITATSTPAQDRRTLAAFDDAVGDAVAELRRIEAPEDVRAEHRRLIAELGAYGDQIDRARRAFDGGDRRELLAEQTRLASAVAEVGDRIARTLAAIDRELAD